MPDKNQGLKLMAKKTETKVESIEREYVIPLREKCRVVPRYKKTNKAVKTIKEFLVKHMKIYDRDLNKIKLDSYLNEFLWNRGIKNPPHKVKIKAVKEKDIVRVELVDTPDKIKFKKAKLEKREKKAEESAKKKPEKTEKPEDSEEKSEEEQKKEDEKKAAVVEAGKQQAELQHKKQKHQTAPKQKQVRQRKELSK